MKKYIIIFLLFVIGTYSHAEVVNKLVVTGNDRISKETIKVYGEISLPADYKSNDVDKILKNLYSTNFFDDIKININQGVLEIIVKEYPIINSVKIEGELKKERSKKLLERIETKKNGPFVKNILSQELGNQHVGTCKN